MYKTFYTWLNLNECAVVSDKDDLTLNLVTNLEIRVEVIPWMWGKLLETESDTLLLLIEVKNNDLDLLVKSDNLFRVIDTAPREIGDMDKTVHTAKVNEYAVIGDILDCSLENLTLLKLTDELCSLLLLLCLKKCLVGNYHIAELLIDLNDLAVNILVDKLVIVADRLDVDLRTWKEGLDSEHVDNHTALGAGLYKSLYYLILLECLVNSVPRLEGTCLTVRKNELSFSVLCRLDIHLYLVSDLEVRIIAELGYRNNALVLASDGNNNFALVHRCNNTLYNIVLNDL